MKHALLIIAHKNIEQLNRLVNALKSDQLDLFIHLDHNWKLDYSQIESLKSDSVHVIDKRLHGVLDNWSLVEIAIALLSEAYRFGVENGIQYGYFYLLSGQDYPIKPVREITCYLDHEYPIPLIDCTPYSVNNWIYAKFNRVRHVLAYDFIDSHIRNRKISKIARIPVYAYQVVETLLFGSPYHILKQLGVQLYGGSAWWALPRPAVTEILEFCKTENEIIKQFKRSTTPEETFFQTIIMQGSMGKQVTLNKPNETSQNCTTYAYFSDIDKVATGHPYIITIDSVERIRSRKSLFARKFDSNVDSTVLDYLDHMNCQ